MIAEEIQKEEIIMPGVRLWTDKSGAIRIGDTRVLLYLVLDAYKHGWTPEQIQEAYTSLNLPDVYMVIGHYLRHKDEIDAQLAEQTRQVEERLLKYRDIEKAQQEKLRRRLKPHLYENEAKVE
jgi:uncharacterized protein (DUF433 family)